MRVGFIGMGDQGGGMARRIVEAGYPTTLWARRAATLEPYADTSAAVASSPAELAAAVDLLCLCVLSDADVEQVLVEQGALAAMAAGSVVAVHSTTHPDTCRRLADQAAERGVTLIDAPVSGGGQMALERRLLVMVGGDDETVERCLPVFETYGDPVIHLGPTGAGQVAKLLNNLLFTAHLGTASNAFTLGSALGVEPGPLAKVLQHGSARSYGLDVVTNMGFTAATGSAHAGPLLQKDARIIVDLAGPDAPYGGLLATADDALAIMEHPR